MALKEIRIVFLLLPSTYTLLLMAVGFYMWGVCVHPLVLFLSTYQITGIVLCAEQINIRVTAMVSVLTELKIVRLRMICGKFVGIFGAGQGI